MRRLMLIMLFVLVLVLQAQEIDHLVLDEALRIQLAPDAPVQLLYVADNPQTVNISARAVSDADDAPDAVLWILDSADQLLAYNDNYGDDSNARIEDLYLPHAGSYTIYVDSFNGVSEGQVEVFIEAHNRFNEEIESGDNSMLIRATLPEDSIYLHEIEFSAEETITIRVRDTSGTLDPYLRVLNSAGEVLVLNDDHHSADTTLDIFDARIADWTVPDDGLYQIEVRDFLGRAGDFELIIAFMTA